MEVVFVILVVALVAVVVWALLQLRKRDRDSALGGVRPPAVNRRRVRASDDPMAAVVASHSQAVEPQEAAVEELRLRAQANRVAAAQHEQQANSLGGTDAEDLQAQSHRQAAEQHQQTADELDRRTPPG